LRDIVEFRDARDWAQFHTPRNLAAALAVEAAELQELLLWQSDEQVKSSLSDAAAIAEMRREIADVLIYSLLFCHAAGIDPLSAIRAKLEENAAKYPVELARGKATKYTELNQEDG